MYGDRPPVIFENDELEIAQKAFKETCLGDGVGTGKNVFYSPDPPPKNILKF